MFNDSLAHFKSEIEPRKSKIAMLELLDDPKRMQVVIEVATVRAHQLIQFPFTGVTEGRMSNVVDQRQCFHQLRIQCQGMRNGSSNLRDFQCVGEAIAEMIGKTRAEYLRLRFDPSKRARVNNAIAV